YVSQLTDLARFYELLDKFDLALKYAQEAADTEKNNSGEYSGKYATALGYLAKILTKIGNVQQAQEILSTSTQILKKNPPKTDEARVKYAETYESIANIYNILGMYTEAQNCLKLANKMSNRIRNSNLAINSTEELASFYIQTGLYENAEDLLKETVRQKEKSSKNFKREIIGPLNQLGELYLIQGEYGLAEKNIRKAMEISSEVFGDSSVKYIESLKNLVDLYSVIGDNEKASSNSLKALSLAKVRYGTNHIEYAKELRAYALIKYNGKAGVQEVEELLKESLNIIKSNLTDKNPLYAEGLKTLAYIYFKSNRLVESEKLAKEANDIWVQKLGTVNLNSAKVNLLLGDIYKSTLDYSKAETAYLAAQKVFGKIFNEKHPDYLTSESRLGQLYLAKGEPEKAIVYFDKTTTIYLDFIKKYFPSLSFREKTKFWDSFKEEFELFDLTAFKLKDKNPKYLGKVYDNTMATKALLLSTSIKVREHIMRSGNQALIDEYSEWISKKELLTRAVSMTKEQLDAAKIDIPKIEKEIEQNEKFLSEQSELFAKNSETRAYKWTEFKKKLSPTEYVVEVLRFRNYTQQFSDSVIYAALLINAKTDKFPESVVIGEGRALETRFLRNFRNSVRFQLDDEISSDHFWKPIKSKIPDNASIYISCEGVYNQVNLETMRNSDGSYAFDKNNIMLLSNTKDLLIRKSKDKSDTIRSNNNRVALFGNPMYYNKQKSSEPVIENQQRGFNFIAGNVADSTLSQSDTTVKDSIRNSTLIASSATFRSSSGIVKERVRQLPGAEYEVKDIDGILAKKNWKSEVYVFAEADEEK
ncbi:MAG: tetratricopeptide repeat protein, partial [Cytophagales bacterium]|nr:tetratricopeptide repeat protein [Cytophagales bacterium]